MIEIIIKLITSFIKPICVLVSLFLVQRSGRKSGREEVKNKSNEIFVQRAYEEAKLKEEWSDLDDDSRAKWMLDSLEKRKRGDR